MRRAVPLLLVAAIAVPGAAAEIQLSPARPLSPALPLMAAAGNQFLPDIAWNGRDFLAIWTDLRSGQAETRTSRLNAEGEPEDPQGRRLGFAGTLIASNGDGYVVAGWGELHRLDNEGVPVRSPLAHTQGRPLNLVSNGSTYLLVTQQFIDLSVPPIWTTTVLNASGATIIEIKQTFVSVLGVGVHDHDYYVVEDIENTSGGEALVVNVIRDSGSLRTIRLPKGGFSRCGSVASAFSATEILIGWSSMYCSNGYAVFRYDGALKREDTVTFRGYFSAQEDGRQFAFFYANPDRPGSRMVRLSSDGTLRDSVPIAVRPSSLRIAPGGARGMAVWEDSRFSSGRDIASRVLTSFDDLAAAPDEATLVSYSTPAAERPQLARAGSHLLAVWFDRTRATLRGSLDQMPLTVATPFNGATSVIAVGSRTFLVTWYDTERETLFAKRIGFDGSVSAPIVVAMHLTPSLLVGPPAVAFDGSAYLVIWTQTGILGMHVTEDGTLIDPLVAAADDQGGSPRSPRLLFTTPGYLLAYSVYAPCSPVVDPCTSSSILKATPLSSLSAAAARPPAFRYLGSESLFDAAVTGDRITYAWAPFVAAQTTFDGAPIAPPRRFTTSSRLACGQPWMSDPRVVSNGAEIVLAWTEGNGCYTFSSTAYKVRAIRVTRNLDPIDDAPFDISSDATPDAPSLTNTPGGVAIAYSAYDAATGGAPRVFVRTLARSDAPIGRRRGVRP